MDNLHNRIKNRVYARELQIISKQLGMRPNMEKQHITLEGVKKC